MAPLLEIQDLQVAYGKAAILKGVSLALNKGEVVGVIGPNGAGKTTLLRAIAGLAPSQGEIRYADQRISGLPAHQIVRRGIILCPERRRLFPEMTVRRNLEMGAYLRRDKAQVQRDLEEMLELFPALGRRLRNQAGTMSGGEQQMLAVARSLMSRPDLFMLDEPSFGLAPLVKKAIMQTLLHIRGRGLTILLSEQDTKLAFEAVEKAYVLENGRINIAGSTQDLLADPHVKEAYLGLA
ncbi:MAG: ABC transporter ATP-binding protein [Thermodesulfobacteriota bacterium]